MGGLALGDVVDVLGWACSRCGARYVGHRVGTGENEGAHVFRAELDGQDVFGVGATAQAAGEALVFQLAAVGLLADMGRSLGG